MANLKPITTARGRSTRVREAAVLLPIFGLLLLMPPVIALFVVPVYFTGIPLIVLYLFGVWLALIGCAAWLGRKLLPPEPAEDRRL